MKHPPIAVVVALFAFAGSCGGSDVEPIVSEVEVTTTIDLLDGALVPTDAGSQAATPDGGTTEPSDSEATADTTGGATTVPGAAPTTSATDADASSATTQPTAGSTDGSATDGSTGTTGSSTGGSTSSGTGGAETEGPLGPGEALIVISGVAYPFVTDTCEVASDAIEVVGLGTASDGADFEASIFFESVDFDDDGTPDRILEIFVDPAVPAGSDADSVPEFYASTFDNFGDGSSGDLVFEIVGQRITGTGNIVDFNGVAFPEDRPGPLTFDALCA